MLYELGLALAAVGGGGIASITGFGIGSMLTPLLSVEVGMKAAVAAVSIPHLIATALRLWLLRHHVDHRVLLHFGILSAIGGLTGALLHSLANSPLLSGLFAGLLAAAGLLELSGQARQVRFGRKTAWAAAVVSGMLGGIVGNQGGIRSAALLGFDVKPRAFVATATATGVLVDAARVPVYVVTEFDALLAIWPTLLSMSLAAVVGTLLGERILRRIPERWFRRAVAVVLLALAAFMFARAASMA